jgi:hypothetical protein
MDYISGMLSFSQAKKKVYKYMATILGFAKNICRCAADFSLLNLPKGKSLGRSKPATNS